MKVIQYVILHDCRFLCPKKHKKREYKKSKSMPPKIILVPLELEKQHHTGEKRNDWTDQQSFSPSLDISRIMEDECMPRSQLLGSFGIFLICPRLVEDSKTGIHQSHHGQDQVVSRKAGWLHHQKLLCFPHHDGWNRIIIQPCGSAKHQCVDKPGWEGFQGCVGKQDDGWPSQDDWVGHSEEWSGT